MTIKVISFDLDGTLLDRKLFDDRLWWEIYPKEYAKEYKISFEEALKFVGDEYRRMDSSNPQWYSPVFWVKHFKMKTTPQQMMEQLKGNIVMFDDVIPALKMLKKKYRLVILTHSPKELLDPKLKAVDLKTYCEHIFSTIQDFNGVKKDGEVYRAMCKKLGVEPSEVLHVGDSYEHDYEAAKEAGLRALFLDRDGKRKGEDVIRSLEEINKFL